MNKTTFNRALHNEENPFTIIPIKIIEDKNLCVEELAIMLMLLSNDDSIVFNSESFRLKTGLGQDKYHKSIKHLLELGYLNKTRKQGAVEWTVNEEPNLNK